MGWTNTVATAGLAVFLIGRVAAAAADTKPTDDVFGLRYCAPPLRPACFDQPRTFGDAGLLRACQRDAGGFLLGVQAYRLCLSQEISRAVLDYNLSVQQFRCGVAARQRCADAGARSPAVAQPAAPKPPARRSSRQSDLPFIP